MFKELAEIGDYSRCPSKGVAEDSEHLDANRHPRSNWRRVFRNCSSKGLLFTHSGDIQRRIPSFCSGSLLPLRLELRRRIDRALCAVVMEI